MKNKKSLLSVLLVAVLLCACVAGMLIFGASAEATNVVYVVTGSTQDAVASDYTVTAAAGTEDGTGNLKFNTVIDAITYASAQEWGAEDTLEIQINAPTYTVNSLTDGNLIFSTKGDAIFRGNDESTLPITIKPHADQSAVTIKWSATGNIYTGANLKFSGLTLDFTACGAISLYCAGNLDFNSTTFSGTDNGITAYAVGHKAENYPFKSAAQFNALKKYDEYADKEIYTSQITFSGNTSVPAKIQPRAVGICDSSFGTTVTFEDGKVSRNSMGGKILYTDTSKYAGTTYVTKDKNGKSFPYATLEVAGQSELANTVNGYGANSGSTACVINIIVNGGTLKGSLVGNAGYYQSGNITINVVFKAGKAGKIYGAYSTSSVMGKVNVIIDGNCSSSIVGYSGSGGDGAGKGSHICIEFRSGTYTGGSCYALNGASTVVKSGAKVGIKINKDMTKTEMDKIVALYDATVKSGAEVYYEIASGTISGQAWSVSSSSKAWTAESGSKIAYYFNGGIYQNDNCAVLSKNYSELTDSGTKKAALNAGATIRMEWNGTIPFDSETSDNSDGANNRYFSPIYKATIPCNVEMIITDLSTSEMNLTPTESGYAVSTLDRWIHTSVIEGDLTLIIDTTEDGWKMNADGTRASDDSNANKKDASVVFKNLQDWSGTTKIGGHARTYINGGDNKTISFNEFQYEPGTQVTVVMENCVATGQVGLSRANGQGAQAQDGQYAIGNVSLSFKNITAGTLYTTGTSYTSSGDAGSGTYGTTNNVYGTVNVSLENCVVNGKTVLSNPDCFGTVEDILVKNCDFGGAVLHYKGKLTFSGSQVHIPTANGYYAGAICLADGTELVIEEDCGKFRHGIGKVSNTGYNTVGGNITIHGGSEYGYSTSGAAGIVGNEITITGGNFEQKIQGNVINISGGRYGVNAYAVKIQGGEVHISGSPRFCWSSTVTGDVVSLDGGTIYMDGYGEGSITATTATAVTTIQKYEGRSLSNGHAILTIPAEYADLINVVDSNVTGYLAKEIDGGTLKVTERVLNGFSAVIVLEDRVSIKYIFDRAQVEKAFLYCKKEANFVFNTPGGVAEGDLSDLVLNEKEGRYEYILPAVSIGDFDFEYSFESSLNSTLKFSIISLANEGAELYKDNVAYANLFKALVDYGASVKEGTTVLQNFDADALNAYAAEKIVPNAARFSITREAETIDFTGVTLLMGDTIGIRLKAVNTTGAKVYYNDTLLTVGQHYAATETTIDLYINAKNFETILDIVVTDAQGNICLNMQESVAHLVFSLIQTDEAGFATNLKLQATAMLVLRVSEYCAALAA